MTTLLAMLSAHAAARPSRDAFVFHADGAAPLRRTWSELEMRSRAIAQSLRACTSTQHPQPRAVLLYPSGLDYVDALFGCLAAGVVAVPAYPPDPMRLARSLPRLTAILSDCRPDVILTTGMVKTFMTAMPEARALGAYDVVATDTVRQDGAGDWSPPEMGAEATAIVQYTSGSTRTPRGVVLRHRDIVGNVVAFARHLRLRADAVSVMWLPLYHDMGLIGGLLSNLYRGGTCHLLSPVDFLRRPQTWVELLSATRASFTGAPNFAFELAARKTPESVRATLDLSNLEVACTGAEPVRSDALDRFAAAFAPAGFRADRFMACYGLAEATLFVSGSARDTSPNRLSADASELSQGRVRLASSEGRTLIGHGTPPPGHRIAIVDDAGTVLGPDTLGEVWVSTTGVAAGYLDNDADTAASFGARLSDGSGPFLRTGDQGFLHDGELYLTGRLKDLVILRGKNFYPQDLEATAERAHSALRPGGSAAFAMESGTSETLALVLEVSPQASCAEYAGIAAAVRAAVVREHDVAPSLVCLLAAQSIPKTSSGKIQRGRCREALQREELEVLFRLEGPDGAGNTPGSEAIDKDQIDAARIAEWLVRWTAHAAGVAKPNSQSRLSQMGIDSLAAATLLWDLENWLGETIPVTIAVGDPTIEELSASIAATLDRENA